MFADKNGDSVTKANLSWMMPYLSIKVLNLHGIFSLENKSFKLYA